MVLIRPFENSYQQKVNLIAMEGDVRKVAEFCASTGVYPNTRGADLAARCGHIGMLEFLMENEIRPSNQGAMWAAEKGYTKVVKLLGRNGVCLHGVPNAALARGHFGIVLFLFKKYRISPTQTGVDIAMGLKNGQAVGFAKKRFNLNPSRSRLFESIVFNS